MFNLIKKKIFKKSFIVYGIIGIVITGIQITCLFLFRNYFMWNDFISITTAYIIALLLHYFLNKHVTFLISNTKIFNMMSIRYILVVIISYLIYMLNLYVMHNILKFPFNISLIITLIINYLINYFLYEKIVFKNKDIQ